MTSISKHLYFVYINKLDDKVNEYSKAYHRIFRIYINEVC